MSVCYVQKDMPEREEFQEIGHCGGQFLVEVTFKDGRFDLSFEVTHSRPGPASLVAVYALPQGIPVGMIELGGIGQELNPPPYPDCFHAFIASDSQGFFGHECPACTGYWRSHALPAHWPMTCPYCGMRDGAYRFLTTGQRRFVEALCEVTREAIQSGQSGKSGIDMDELADAVQQGAETPKPYYTERSQQNRYSCAACGGTDDILGRYGYCSTCGTRNDLQELTQTIEQVKLRTRDRLEAREPLEAAVPNGVSAFDSMARQYAKQLATRVPLTGGRRATLENALFHSVKVRADELKAWFEIDLFAGLDADEIAFVSRMFLRRHVYEHNGGQVDQRYLDESGDTSVRLGQALRESGNSIFALAGLILKMARNLHNGFHELFPPVGKPIEYEKERKARAEAYHARR